MFMWDRVDVIYMSWWGVGGVSYIETPRFGIVPNGIIVLWIGNVSQFIVHHIKEIDMNATTTYINAINAHINSRIAISDAQQKFVVAYNSMTKGEQGDARNAIARLISQRTGVKPITLTKGAHKGLLGFTSKQAGGSDKSEAARAMFVYYTPKVVVEKSSTKKTVRKSADPVQLLLKQFKGLTAAQKRAFKASI